VASCFIEPLLRACISFCSSCCLYKHPLSVDGQHSVFELLLLPTFLAYATSAVQLVARIEPAAMAANGAANGHANGHAAASSTAETGILTGTYRVKAGLAKMLKGGVIMGKHFIN
jgi:hypothetical protein